LKVERRFDPVQKESGCEPFTRRTAEKRAYRTICKHGKCNERELTNFLGKNGQALLSMVEMMA
jgi:hypothetical protein